MCINKQLSIIYFISDPLLAKLLSIRIDMMLNIDNELILSHEGITQGDLLAMTMYAIDVKPLIQKMSMDNIPQVWYAEYTTFCGSLSSLHKWWDKLVEVSPAYGFLWLFVKEDLYKKASMNQMFLLQEMVDVF